MSDAEIAAHFNCHPMNVGAVLGELSGGLVDVDLDTPEAVALAATFLPATPCRWGRRSRPNTHWAYYTAPLPHGKSYADQDTPAGQKSTLIELRVAGMAMLPGSVHPSGERIEWASDDEPARVDADTIAAAVRHLAIAALLARHWPARGQRHQTANAGAGMLLRAGLDEHATTRIVVGAARAARDEEAAERGRDVATTAAALGRGEDATGGPTLAELLRGDGERAVRQLQRWLSSEDSSGSAPSTGRPSGAQSDQLLALAENIELFVESGNESAYARVPVAEHHENWALRSRGFKRWLTAQYFATYHRPVRRETFTEALDVLEARAQFNGDHHTVDIRVGGYDEIIFLDLANDAWEAVEITAEGWHVVANPPARFRRSGGMLPLPAPVAGGAFDGLLEFINTGTEEDSQTLVETFLVQALRPRGPFCGLEFTGEAGTAKSTAARVLRALLDPNRAPLRAEPSDIRDLMISCGNSWVLALDNVSHLPAWLSDALCRIATGGGFSTRVLYSDSDETLIDVARPFILNGIGSVVTRGDLLDRTIPVVLPLIPDQHRRPEAEFWRAFEAARPRLLGALCDAASTALRRHRDVHLRNLPRMADVAIWITAAAPALGWDSHRFLNAYGRSRSAGHAEVLADSPLVRPLRLAVSNISPDFIETTAADLLITLTGRATDAERAMKTWPTTAAALGSALRRLAPSLREHGPTVEFVDRPELGRARRRIRVQRKPDRTPVA